jgi:hypothetical protein
MHALLLAAVAFMQPPTPAPARFTYRTGDVYVAIELTVQRE